MHDAVPLCLFYSSYMGYTGYVAKFDSATGLKLIIPLLYWLVVNVAFVLLLASPATLNQITGIVITNIAFAFWVVARVQLGSAFSIAPRSKFLVTTGLYGKLRHPVYYFSILAVVGVGVFLWDIIAVPVVLTLITLEMFRIRKEEAVLTKTFGKQYLTYKQQTWF